MLVDDSSLALDVLTDMLATAPDVRIVGTAQDGRTGFDLVRQLRPNVVLTDLHMPSLDGLQLTQSVMATTPTPVLVVSGSTTEEDVFRLLAAGAVDVYLKPDTLVGAAYDRKKQELIEKVRVAAGVTVFRRRAPPPTAPDHPPLAAVDETCIITIGASTGGPQALRTILTSLPRSFPVPIICVQHIADGFLKGLVDWLARESDVEVRIAEHGERVQPGIVYFAAERSHLTIGAGRKIQHVRGAPMNGHIPSVSATFSSIARTCGADGIGILLTGMGRDGADGLNDMRRAGALTIAQDAATSLVYGMPAQAVALGAASMVLPLPEIARRLRDLELREKAA